MHASAPRLLDFNKYNSYFLAITALHLEHLEFPDFARSCWVSPADTLLLVILMSLRTFMIFMAKDICVR